MKSLRHLILEIKEKSPKNSNPWAESRHTHIRKSGPELKEDETRENADTDVPAYSNSHPDGRHTVKTGYAIKCDIMEDDHGSEPRLTQAVDITDDLKNVIDDTCDYDRSEDDQGKPEIRFGYDNFSVGYEKHNDVVYNYNELTKIEFQISLLPKGVGQH